MLAWGNLCAHSDEVAARDFAIIHPEPHGYLIATWIGDV
jgi:hypothetical protein